MINIKKTITVIILVLLLISILLTTASCGGEAKIYTTPNENSIPLVRIVNKPYLSYDKDTKIIYYLFKEDPEMSYDGFGYMSPYLGENGYPCRYIDGKIIETNQ